VWPLFRPPRVTVLGRFLAPAAPAPGAALGVDEYRGTASILSADGSLRLAAAHARCRGAGADRDRGPRPRAVTAVAPYGRDHYAIGTSDGRVIPLEMKYDVGFDGRRPHRRRQAGLRRAGGPGSRAEAGDPRVTVAAPDSGPVTVAQVGPRELIVLTVTEKKAPIGGCGAKNRCSR